LRGQGEGRRLNGRRLRPVGGGAPVRYTIPLGIVIFLVLLTLHYATENDIFNSKTQLQILLAEGELQILLAEGVQYFVCQILLYFLCMD